MPYLFFPRRGWIAKHRVAQRTLWWRTPKRIFSLKGMHQWIFAMNPRM